MVRFRIVAIGASAGGITALQSFFERLTTQRFTRMEVDGFLKRIRPYFGLRSHNVLNCRQIDHLTKADPHNLLILLVLLAWLLGLDSNQQPSG